MIDSLQSLIMSLLPALPTLPSFPTLPSIPTITSFLTTTFWNYLHFAPFLILLWPFVITLTISLASLSTWLFWLFTSLVFGLIQLIYVLYQFMMISIDLGVLTLLKTYTTMRSFVRYYTIRSGMITNTATATGNNSSSSSRRQRRKRLQQKEYVNKPGRKREWRKKLDAATSLKDFLEIEIQEPPLLCDSHNNSNSNSNIDGKKQQQNNSSPSSSSLSLSPKKNSSTSSPHSQNITLSSSTSTPQLSEQAKIPSPPPSPSFNRSKSSADFHNQPSLQSKSKFRTRSNPVGNKNNNVASDQYDDIEKELGMTGTMLLQTTYRLKEVRIQASLVSNHSSSTGSTSNTGVGGKGIHNNGGTNNTNHGVEIINESHLEENDDEIENDLQLGHHESSSITPLPLPTENNENAAASQLKFLLQGVVKRNHLSINKLLIQDASSVMESGRHHLSEQSRNVILNYHEEVEHCLKWLAESQLSLEKQQYSSSSLGLVQSPSSPSSVDGIETDHQQNNNSNNNNNNNNTTPEMKLYKELSDRLNLIRKLKHNMGRTALMLSGGGAQAMYHLGTIKALCESKLYDDIEVISGTSGGSISAAMCAIKTRDELLKEICVPHVSTDYGQTGRMKKEDIRWFPTVVQMGEYWLKNKLLVDSKDFKRCCEFYFKDITFEEAFKKTGKHICITVSASRAEGSGDGSGGGDGAQRLLLNHISTPHVTLASAVGASCALPGVMAPAKLVTKNNDSKQELFEVDGVEWIDGSVQADLPFKRISTLFNVSNYIVCQTNFHVLPFLHKAHHPKKKSFYWRAFQTCEWDIRNRALNLSRLGLFPKIFGQDISKVFKQRYHGDLTLVPRFTTMQVFGLKSLVNPTYEDMKVYLQSGQSSAWPYLSVIREMLRLESAIDKCIKSLNERINDLSPDNDWDDVESITSATNSRYKRLSARRDNELLKQKVLSLELENLEMKKQLELMQRKCGIHVVDRSGLPPISPTGQIEFIRHEQQKLGKKKSKFWKKDK